MQGTAVGGEANIVNRPTVDADGGDAFRGNGRGFTKAFFKTCKEGIERSTEPGAAMDGAVGDTMNDFDLRLSVDPAEHGDATAFSA